MYSDSDLESAVAAGALPREAAEALRAHVSGLRAAPAVDEEHFRLVTGFNDIFVAIAAIILLVAVWWIGNGLMSDRVNYAWKVAELTGENSENFWLDRRYKGLGGLVCAVTAWLLAEYFTRKRRMAFPSIVLLVAFVAGLSFGLAYFFFDWEYTRYGILPSWMQNEKSAEFSAAVIAQQSRETLAYAVIGFVTLGMVYLHWRRFHVPISVAAGTAALSACLLGLLIYAFRLTSLNALALTMILAAGLAVFAFAMWWDMSDRERRTRRSDVAFWLHLLAAPMIAHPLFALIGISSGDRIGLLAVIGVVAVYLGFGLVALAIDRRALLVSALAYVLIALTALFRQFGVVELNVAITALLIGSALLLLSAFWHNARAAVVGLLPGTVSRTLPETGRIGAST